MTRRPPLLLLLLLVIQGHSFTICGQSTIWSRTELQCVVDTEHICDATIDSIAWDQDKQRCTGAHKEGILVSQDPDGPCTTNAILGIYFLHRVMLTNADPPQRITIFHSPSTSKYRFDNIEGCGWQLRERSPIDSDACQPISSECFEWRVRLTSNQFRVERSDCPSAVSDTALNNLTLYRIDDSEHMVACANTHLSFVEPSPDSH